MLIIRFNLQHKQRYLMRIRSYRRHQSSRHMWRRLKEDRNQHYSNLDCFCWTSPKHMARFREQPKLQQCYCCCNQRRNYWLPKNERMTMQERRFMCDADDQLDTTIPG